MRVIEDYGEELQYLESRIRGLARPGEILQVLEAGCGREWYFKLEGIAYELTGVDLDERALEARRVQKRDLDKAIVGDLRTVSLEPDKYDVVYCAFVLEHVADANAALANLARSLRPGGILIVRVPDRDSVHGFVTRFTPHWVHVFYHRHAWGLKDAESPASGHIQQYMTM